MKLKMDEKIRFQIQPRADRVKLKSPLEELFIETLEKYLASEVEILPQYEVNTLAGKFRLDFLLTVNSKKVAFECDGAEFHDKWHDEWRDSLILGTGNIDAIYRFRGKDIHTFLQDCIYLIYHFDKEFFYDRYSLISSGLISEELKKQMQNFDQKEKIMIGYKAIDEYGNQVGWLGLEIGRRDKNDKAGHWNVLYNVAKNNLGLRIEELMEISKREWGWL